jgi:hypothetical protein
MCVDGWIGGCGGGCIYETDASNVTWELRKAGCTDAVELFDNRSLKTCEDFEHLHFLRGLANTATALLIECRGADAAMLKVFHPLPSPPLSLPSLDQLSPARSQ